MRSLEEVVIGALAEFELKGAELGTPPESTVVNGARRCQTARVSQPRRLSSAACSAVHCVRSFAGDRIEGLTGVWVDGLKVAAQVRQPVASHLGL